MWRVLVLRCCVLAVSLLLVQGARADDKADLFAAFEKAVKLAEEGKYKEAELQYLKALRLAPEVFGINHQNTAAILNNLAALFRKQGKYADAVPLVKFSLEIREKVHGKDHPDVAASLHDLANLYYYLGKYVEALPLYKRSLEIRENALGKDHPAVAASLNDLATLYSVQGKYAEAEPLYKRSLEIREKALGKNHPHVATSLNDLAILYSDLGKYAEAEPLYKRSLEIREKALGKDHPHVADPLTNLGILYSRLGKLGEAEPLYKRSLEIREKAHGKDHPDVAASLANLALLYFEQGKHVEAVTLYKQSLEIQEKVLGKDHPDVAATLANLAILHYSRGKYADAELLYKRGLEIREKAHGKDHPGVADSLHNLALLVSDQGRYREAQYLQTRLRQVTRIFLLRELPYLSPGEQREFLSVSEVGRFARALSLAYRQPADASIRDASVEWLLNGKAIALEAQTQFARLQRDADDAEGRAILTELATLRRQEAALAFQASNPEKAEAVALQRADLEARRRELEKRLAARGGAASAFATPWIELDALRKALPADGLLIDIVRFEPCRFGGKPGEKLLDEARYVAWLVPPAGDVRMIDLGDAKAIDDTVADVRKAMEPAAMTLKAQGEIAAEKAVRTPLAKLAKLVLDPLRPHLDPAKRWVISPEGALWLAPWAALPLDEKTFAIEKHTIQLVVSGRDLLPKTPIPGRASAPVVFADPDFNGAAGILPGETRGLSNELKLGNIPRLPGTATEADAIADKIARVFGADPVLFTESKATTAAFLALKRPKAVTLATHGFFLPTQEIDPKEKERLDRDPNAKPRTQLEDPLLRCGLLLAGCNKPGDAGRAGVLTGHEVLSTDLRGCQLVTLSACETGLGDVRQGEGVAGLRQAFQLAGAESVLASLWKVPDDETTLQMVAFMDALTKGKDRVEALAIAQRSRISARREKFGAAHPFNWAAFSLTGAASSPR